MYKKHNIEFQFLSKVHIQQSLSVLADAFLNRNEPSLSHMYPYPYIKRLAHFVDNASKNGVSYVAIDTQNNNNVVALLLNFDDNPKQKEKQYRLYLRKIKAMITNKCIK